MDLDRNTHTPVTNNMLTCVTCGPTRTLTMGTRGLHAQKVEWVGLQMETTPINQLISHNWLIYIFSTYSQSSFIYANVQQDISSRDRERSGLNLDLLVAERSN